MTNGWMDADKWVTNQIMQCIIKQYDNNMLGCYICIVVLIMVIVMLSACLGYALYKKNN